MNKRRVLQMRRNDDPGRSNNGGDDFAGGELSDIGSNVSCRHFG
jgi:hypothetical protein